MTQEGGEVVVRDLGSTNGIRINGQRVEIGRLRPGDELSIAHIRYRLEKGQGHEQTIAEPAALAGFAARAEDRGSAPITGPPPLGPPGPHCAVPSGTMTPRRRPSDDSCRRGWPRNAGSRSSCRCPRTPDPRASPSIPPRPSIRSRGKPTERPVLRRLLLCWVGPVLPTQELAHGTSQRPRSRTHLAYAITGRR